MIGDAGDAVRLPHLAEERRAVGFPIEDQRETAPVRIGPELLLRGLAGNLPQQARDDVAAQRLQQTGVDGLLDHEERQPQCIVNPVVGDPPQAQALAGHVTSGGCRLRTVVDAHVAVHVEGANRLRCRLHPLSAQLCRPAGGGLAGRQVGQFASQAAHLRYAVQPQQPAELARRLASQFLHGAEATQRHEPHQYQHLYGRVVTFQAVQQPIGTGKQPVGQQRRQGAQHPAVGNVQTALEPRGRTAWQRAHRRHDSVDHTGAGRAQTRGRRGILHTA